MLPDRAHMMRLLVCHSKAISALTKEEDDRVKISVLALPSPAASSGASCSSRLPERGLHFMSNTSSRHTPPYSQCPLAKGPAVDLAVNRIVADDSNITAGCEAAFASRVLFEPRKRTLLGRRRRRGRRQ